MRQYIDIINRIFEDQEDNDGDAYFDPEALRMAKNQNETSRDKLIYMSPEDYLKIARAGYSEVKMSTVNKLLGDKVVFNSIPFIGFIHDGEGTAQVCGHEGRHRAKALAALGVKRMPVLFCHRYDENGQSIRWGSVNGDGIDRFRDEWPVHIYGERGEDDDGNDNSKNRIDFPVSDPRTN